MWHELFVPKQGTTRKRVPFVVTYHPGLPNIGGILKELHPLLSLSNRCKQAIHDLPMLAFRRPKSLKDCLVRAEFWVPEELINVLVEDVMFVIILL